MGCCWIKKKGMYNNDDIQAMLRFLEYHNGRPEYNSFMKYISEHTSDSRAIKSCINEGWYEEFYRYDSDVCEQFISCFEKFFITNKKFNTFKPSSRFIVVCKTTDKYGVVDTEDYEVEFYTAETLVSLIQNCVCSIEGVWFDGRVEVIY